MELKMSTIDKVKEMAASSMSVRDIADKLGHSRSSIYHICKYNNIPYVTPRYHFTGISSQARVITGGMKVPITSHVAGTISELLVAADLMARGWWVYMPVMLSKSHDIVAFKGIQMITVEVRSARRNATGFLSYAKKNDSNSSHRALVVTGEPVSYIPDLDCNN
jgi:hypothetical protein